MYGARGKNFLQIGAPTWARTLADVTAQMAARWLRATPPDRATLSGTYHATAASHTSWCAFATEILERAEAMGLGRSPIVAPIPTSAYPTPARRLMNSVLDTAKLGAVFGLALPAWDESLTLCLQELRA